MNRRSFIATLLAAPLALVGWKRKPQSLMRWWNCDPAHETLVFPEPNESDLELLESRTFTIGEIESYWSRRPCAKT